jgi:aspartate aminotransferase
MGPVISPTAAGMPRSGIREVMDLAWQAPGCIHLEVGQPDFPTPPHVVEAAVEALRGGWTRYVQNAGVPDLREELASKVVSRNGIVAAPENIVVTNGAVEAIYIALIAIAEPGDAVLVPDPGWPNYTMMTHLLHLDARPYRLRAERQFLPAIEDLEAALTPRTRALVLNSPSNPLGTVLPASLLADISAFAARHDLIVISDEAYDEITFTGTAPSIGAVGDPDRIVTCFSFSKTFAMTGWRVGYLVAPPALSEVLQKLQEPIIACVNAASQQAAIAALRGPRNLVGEMVAAYRRRRDLLLAQLDQDGVAYVRPDGAFYAWVSIAGYPGSSRELSRRLLAERGVALAPGSAFGASGEGWVRLSLATEEAALLEGAKRLVQFIRDEQSRPQATCSA